MFISKIKKVRKECLRMYVYVSQFLYDKMRLENKILNTSIRQIAYSDNEAGYSKK